MRLDEAKGVVQDVLKEVSKVIVGQREVLEQVMTSILCNAHALLEGYPGLAKTLAIKSLSEAMELKFSRIQHTPDLMPSDITGTYVIEETSGGKRNFKFQQGPIFANVVLADEINRATPKTQSALLEAMQEKQVTVGNNTYKLDQPFFVLATQNPIEQEGSLALDQTVFVNGTLKTGTELLKLVKNDCLVEDEKGTKLYNINAWTYALNTSGNLTKQKCLLYTLPYQDELITIQTRTGRKIKVTKNHPFLVNDRGIITWKQAEELTKEDYLISPAQLTNMPTIQLMSHQEAIKRMTQKPINEIIFDKDFIFWIAFLLSDGSITEKCVEAVQKNYPEALDRFIEVSKNYGFKVGTHQRKGCRYARIYSKSLVEYLNIRFGVSSGKDKEIPSWFLSLPEDLLKEFVKTFIALESSLRDNRIVFTQKSSNNVNIMSYMLLRLGIISWTRHDGKIFRLKIQGKDVINYLQNIGWITEQNKINLDRKIKSSFRVIPIERKAVLEIVELLGINSFHTMKNRKDLTKRKWYNSYKGIKQGETVMSVDALKEMTGDLKQEIQSRKQQTFRKLADKNMRSFSAGIGLSMTQIAEKLDISSNQVWKLYNTGTSQYTQQIQSLATKEYTVTMRKLESLMKYFTSLLSQDIIYDKIKSISYEPSQGMAFGLTVPQNLNYVAGFGACGINHNTYPLPEAQADRFLLKILVEYPTQQEEMEIVDRFTDVVKDVSLKTVLKKTDLLRLQELTRQVPIANDIKKYAVDLVFKTRTKNELIEYGASPRATMGLVLASKARALIQGRKYVSKDDIKYVALPILRHRIIPSFEAERQNLGVDDLIKKLL